MSRYNPPIVRNVPGEKPTPSQLAEGRRAARANHGPTHDQIQLRAFQIYEARGRADGHDVEDWTQAERELHRND
jgi:hypothetical protein